jgi:phage anti-repressor protein
MKNNIFINLLKKYTNIDNDFIEIFFKKFKIGFELDFNIKDIGVSKYLNIELNTIRRRLNNTFSKNINYIEKVDYIKIKSGKTTGLQYMINYPCFERLAMQGDSKKSETVRMYFIKLREFITNNQYLIYQTMEQKNNLKKLSGYESIYFFAIDERNDNIFKVGRTTDIIKRLNNYNIGRIKEVDLKYFAVVKNAFLIEKCIKLLLSKNKVYENKEIFKIEPLKLKKVIDKCYCKNVTSKENDKLYEELSDLLKLYSYTKDKINIKPFIIIDK